MKVISSKRVSDSCSDNPKAAPQTKTCGERRRTIQNPKWMGIVAIVVAFALCGAVAEAQIKTPEIVWAGGHFGAAPSREWVASEFRPLHYVDGRDGVFKFRLAQSKPERRNGPADELVRLNVDVLMASSTAEALALKNATRTIPIVFIVSTDPVADGLVDSLARPGGNVTGVTTIVTALAGKRLELLKETVPKLARVAVLWDSQDPSSAQHWKESQFAARELGLQLHSMQVSIIDKIDAAFNEAIKAKSAALAVTPSPLVDAYAKYIAALATKYRLPAIFDRGEFVANGGLMSYGPDPVEPYRRAAAMVDKILKGAKPADIPVEQPTKFELVINLKVAKQIGLTIPPAMLSRAEKVIR
jgi:putative ABC transport system substrate-binding protein